MGTLIVTGMDMQAFGAQAASPRSASTRQYVWVGQVKSIDPASKTVTFSLPFKEHVARYVYRFKPGDHIIMFWGSPKPDETDAIIYVEEHVVGGIHHSNEFGYVLPGISCRLMPPRRR